MLASERFESTVSSSIVLICCRLSDYWLLRGDDDFRARRIPRQQTIFADEALRGMPSAGVVAKVLGQELGQREILLRTLPS